MQPLVVMITRLIAGTGTAVGGFLYNLGWTLGLALVLMLSARELYRAYYGRVPRGLWALAFNIAIVVVLAVFGVALETRLLPLLLG